MIDFTDTTSTAYNPEKPARDIVAAFRTAADSKLKEGGTLAQARDSGLVAAYFVAGMVPPHAGTGALLDIVLEEGSHIMSHALRTRGRGNGWYATEHDAFAAAIYREGGCPFSCELTLSEFDLSIETLWQKHHPARVGGHGKLCRSRLHTGPLS